ncbi:hypothetical protein G962_01831 [Escherichia coli UMEA 3304-1]|nr:hypothetical protein G962_01831 [Escherichia coli UMEA 3304-1]
MHRLNLNGYEPDRHHEAAVAFCIHAGTDELTSPVHQHRKGQLILALHGAGNDSNLLIVFYVQIMPDDFVMQLHRF